MKSKILIPKKSGELSIEPATVACEVLTGYRKSQRRNPFGDDFFSGVFNDDFFERFFSSIIDSIIQKFPGEVAVLHGAFKKEDVKTVLIPFSNDIHAILATEIAPALIDYFNCKIKILMVCPPEMTLNEREEREAKVKELINENSIPAEIKIVKDADILITIVNQSKAADLILMGGKTGDFLELLLGRSLAQEITEEAACPVLWVKEFEEREPLWKLLLKSPKKIGVENG